MYTIRTKRIYTAVDTGDGYRVLADQLWPRGIKKEASALDCWIRELAPSTELRKSFAHDAGRFAAFRAAYRAELDGNPAALAFARSCVTELQSRNVTLLYAAKDETFNNASVLREWLMQQIERGNRSGSKSVFLFV